jgi:hypothetical protein
LPTTSLARTRFVIKVIIVVCFLLPAPFTPTGSRFLVVVVFRFRRLRRWWSRSDIARRGSNRYGFLWRRLCINGLCGRNRGRWRGSGGSCRRLSLLDRWCSRGYRRGSLDGWRIYGIFDRDLLILEVLKLVFPSFELFVINIRLLVLPFFSGRRGIGVGKHFSKFLPFGSALGQTKVGYPKLACIEEALYFLETVRAILLAIFRDVNSHLVS